MSGEFSLLQHLGVSVPEPASRGQASGGHRNECRVWAPVHHPPLRGDAMTREPPQRGRAVTGKRYADPASEVLLGREDGKEVEYVIYNSKVPSIYGINKQLADARRMEQLERQARDRETAQPPVTLEDDHRDASRRRLLSELHQCNQEQAQQKREERLREEERRAAREADQLCALEAQEKRAAALARARRLADEQAINDANRAMALHRRDAAAAARGAEQAFVAQPFITARAQDDYSEAAARRVQALVDDNQALAACARERRERERELDELYAQRMAARAEEEAANEQAALERARGRARAYAEEMEALAAVRREELARQRQAEVCPVFLAPEKDETQLASQRAQRAEEIREANRRLAEQKRAATAAQAERDKALAQKLIEDDAAAERRERERQALRKTRDQEDYRVAMEKAIAARQARLSAERDTRAEPVPFLFGDAEAEKRELARKRKEQHLMEEQRVVAEERRAARLQRDARQVEAERAALQEEARAMQRDDLRRRERTAAEHERLRQDLETQIARRLGERQEKNGLARAVNCEPVVPPRELYRCPVTGRLLPADAFDFGRTH